MTDASNAADRARDVDPPGPKLSARVDRGISYAFRAGILLPLAISLLGLFRGSLAMLLLILPLGYTLFGSVVVLVCTLAFVYWPLSALRILNGLTFHLGIVVVTCLAFFLWDQFDAWPSSNPDAFRELRATTCIYGLALGAVFWGASRPPKLGPEGTTPLTPQNAAELALLLRLHRYNRSEIFDILRENGLSVEDAGVRADDVFERTDEEIRFLARIRLGRKAPDTATEVKATRIAQWMLRTGASRESIVAALIERKVPDDIARSAVDRASSGI